MDDRFQCGAVIPRQLADRPVLADSRLMHRSITARCCKAMLNGKNRPLLVSCDPIAERPLRKQKLSFRYSYLYSYCRPNVDVDKPNRLRSASVTGHADGA